MSRVATVDLDDADDVLRLWAEAARVADHRKIDPELRADLMRLALAADPETRDEMLFELDRVAPAAVLEARWRELVPNGPTIGSCRQVSA